MFHTPHAPPPDHTAPRYVASDDGAGGFGVARVNRLVRHIDAAVRRPRTRYPSGPIRRLSAIAM